VADYGLTIVFIGYFSRNLPHRRIKLLFFNVQNTFLIEIMLYYLDQLVVFKIGQFPLDTKIFFDFFALIKLT